MGPNPIPPDYARSFIGCLPTVLESVERGDMSPEESYPPHFGTSVEMDVFQKVIKCAEHFKDYEFLLAAEAMTKSIHREEYTRQYFKTFAEIRGFLREYHHASSDAFVESP